MTGVLAANQLAAGLEAAEWPGLVTAATPAHLAWLAGRNRWAFPAWLQFTNAYLTEFLLSPESRFCALEVPIRHGKSSFVSVNCAAWHVGMFPDKQVLLTTYSDNLSRGFGRAAREIIENHGPDLFNVKVRWDARASNDWKIDKREGGMRAVSRGGTITGTGGDLIIIDDPIKDAEEAQSKSMRDRIHEWYQRTLRGRLEPGGKIILVMCMTGDTPVLRPDGSTTPLSDLRRGDEIATYSEGGLTTARVRNWANQGPDTVYEVRMTSGRRVRANARHPFLTVDGNGVETWLRLESLRAGMKVRSFTAPTPASSVPSKSADLPRSARACACLTTERPAGRRDIAHPLPPTLPVGLSASRAATASPRRTTTGFLRSRAVVAPFAEGGPMRSSDPSTGARSSVSTMTTSPGPYVACCATTAITRSPTRFPSSRQPSHTWSTGADEIVEIVEAGVEHVFDIEVEATRNFIANGLCSHNSRWHEDDLTGRLLDRENYEGDHWERIHLPALAEPAPWEITEAGGEEHFDYEAWTDPIGRSLGDPLWPERWPAPVLRQIRAAVGPLAWSCTPAETPILMADFTLRPISQVQAGDKIIGFTSGLNKGGKNNPGGGSRLVEATVRSTFSKQALVNNLVMESGRQLRCTADHKWWVPKAGMRGRHGQREDLGLRPQYQPAIVGRELRFVDPPEVELTPRQRDLWHYLSGMVDGEGSIMRSALQISQSPSANPEVFAHIQAVLDELGLSYRVKRWADYKTGRENGAFLVRGVRDVYRTILRVAPGGKADQMRRVLIENSQKFVRERDRVRTISPAGVEEVFALETTTGNYIAWGYASSNSNFQQLPTTPGGDMFPKHNWLGVNEVKRGLDMVCRWDLADNTGSGDFAACSLLARDNKGFTYVLEVRRIRKRAAEVERWVQATAEEFRGRYGRGIHHVVEQEPGSAGKTVADNYVLTVLAGYDVEAKPTSKAKVLNAQGLAAQQQAGNVYLLRVLNLAGQWGPARWWDDFTDEAADFPRGINDDMVDTASQAYNDLVERARKRAKRRSKVSSAASQSVE